MKLITSENRRFGRFGNQSGIASCFIYGCLGVAVLIIVGLIVAFFVTRHVTNKTINTFTQETPIELEVVDVTEGEYQSLEQRLTNFVSTAQAGTNTATLRLTGHDINALIARNEEMKAVKDMVRVEVVDDKVGGKISVPLDQLMQNAEATEIPFLSDKLEGRHFNGEMLLNVSIEEGELDVRIRELKVGDQTLPKEVVAQLKDKNFASELKTDPKTRKMMERVDSLIVEDGEIVLKIRGTNSPETDEEPKEKAPEFIESLKVE